MTRYLDIFELAEILGISPATIRTNMRRRPKDVPPRMHVPGTEMLRWKMNDVALWRQERQMLNDKKLK